MLKIFLPRLRDIFFIAVFLGVLPFAPRMLALDSDLGRHLTMGNFILDAHRIPTSDLFSLTLSGEPRPPYEWLTQVIFAIANRVVGLDGVILICALIIATAFSIIYMDSVRRSRMPLVSLTIVFLACASSSLHWLPRPHLITFLFLAIWIKRLERVHRGERVPLWHFPLLMLFWANAHGGFVFGVLAWLAYFGGWIWETLRKSSTLQTGKAWMAIGGFSMLSSILTPSGWGNWQAVLSNHSTYILCRTIETMPPNFTQPGTWPFALLLVITLIVILVTRKTQHASHIFLIGGFAVLALLMARSIPLFVIVAAPILSENLSGILAGIGIWNTTETNIARVENAMHGALWPIVVSGGIAFIIGVHYQVQKEALTDFDAQVFPVKAADWLAEHPQSGNMFNDINWGGYLLYRLWPGQDVFIDSQTDFYGEALVRKYETALTARKGWENILGTYDVKWTILPASAPLTLRLSEAGWNVIYEDATAIILRAPK